jgi:hypothetical protein
LEGFGQKINEQKKNFVERQTAFPSKVSLFDSVTDNKFFRGQFFFQTLDKLDVFFDAFSS